MYYKLFGGRLIKAAFQVRDDLATAERAWEVKRDLSDKKPAIRREETLEGRGCAGATRGRALQGVFVNRRPSIEHASSLQRKYATEGSFYYYTYMIYCYFHFCYFIVIIIIHTT